METFVLKQSKHCVGSLWTPLHLSVVHGFTDIAKLLISRGADVNESDRFDVSPLHTAAELGNTDCLVLLLEGGADCNISTKYSKHGSYTAVPHPGGTTPLHLSASNNHVDCLRHLIWHGADYNAVDDRGCTSLYLAAEKGLSECIHVHLDNALWKDILSLPEKYKGDTPLHQCVKQNMLDCVVKLLRRGSDVNHRNCAGYSPLHLAVMTGENYNIEIVKALLTYGYNTDVNLLDNNFYSPLHYACFNDAMSQARRPELAALLLAYGADFNIKNKRGDKVLISELEGRHRDCTILSAIARCTVYLPTFEALGLNIVNPTPFLMQGAGYQGGVGFGIGANVPHEDFQDLRQQHVVLARQWSENQQAKISWYRDMVRGPRMLQHYCRCVIRAKMGPRRLMNIPQLPLPTTMKEYLLLQNG
ncbi:ankyrin-1-like isoform X2 [Dreissena polymorpha]|uniref:ankyrin-1-like isoform X2 n=1 Tax=Dreissena polymorpha TaxID=45954 RepID=UPI002264BAD6|nr:ankyrin-1-like isoform X2 [Dreissena polymorpha]